MKTPSTESFHSTRSRPSSAEFTPPPETTSHRNAQEGMSLNTTLTTHNVGQLNNQCQKLGLSPRYEIDGDQQVGFGGYLQLGPHKITMDERWPSKKAAREGLASKGLAIVKGLQQIKKAEEASSSENWVGMLHTFYQTRSPTGDSVGPIFTEYPVGSLFACTCLISPHSTPFGSETVAYTSKKAARSNAAREAMKFLISSGYATPDGKPGLGINPEKSPAPAACKGKKSGLKHGASTNAITTVLNNTDATFTQKVNELCPLLGLNNPQYRLQATGSSLYSGASYFLDEPLLRGPIGEVENIYGKKNAKEESARGVWKELVALAEQRGLIGEETDQEQDLL